VHSSSFLFWCTFAAKFGSNTGIANGHLFPKFGKLWLTLPGTKIFSKILKGIIFFVILFCPIIWLSAMKFDMVRGICAQQVTSYFGELWPIFVGAEIFDSDYLLYFLLQRNEIWQG